MVVFQNDTVLNQSELSILPKIPLERTFNLAFFQDHPITSGYYLFTSGLKILSLLKATIQSVAITISRKLNGTFPYVIKSTDLVVDFEGCMSWKSLNLLRILK